MEEQLSDPQTLARIIRRVTYNAYGFTIVGNPAPKVERAGQQMRELRVGDLVVETTTVYRVGDRANDLDAVGYLEEIADEMVEYDEPWDEAAEGRPHPTERVFYIRTLDGRRFRWVNADFIAAPVELP